MSTQDSNKIKRVNLTFHEGNNNRRVRYNQKDFDVLVVSFTVDNDTRLFEISVDHLPDNDSIHLKYDPFTRSISWSPQNIEQYVVEIRK